MYASIDVRHGMQSSVVIDGRDVGTLERCYNEARAGVLFERLRAEGLGA